MRLRNASICSLALLLVFTGMASFASDKNGGALTSVFCQALVKHVPSADVEYQSGVDVYGKPVAPADLAGGGNFKLDPVSIPLTVDLMKTLDLNADYPFDRMQRDDINLGVLTIDGDRVSYNGKPLTDEQQENLAVLCMKPSAPQK